MKARVFVSLKPSVLDPQGQAIAKALASLGHKEVGEVRAGKFFDVDLGPSGTREALEAISAEVLSNPVIEDYTVEVCAE